MRHTQALEILKQIDGYDGGAASAFAWRKAWLARKDMVAGALLKSGSPLRRIPGLNYLRLAGLMLDSQMEKPFEIVTAAEAVQVGSNGHRLRAFLVAKGTTLKVVREASYYGPATLREIALRCSMQKIPTFLVPQLEMHERKNGFIYLREELIEGRSYNIRKDRHLFSAQIISPLADFYERQGITMLPLSEALGPLTAFAAEHEKSPRLTRLIAANPQVAVALCHNDVVTSNLAVNQKGVHFLDWGSAIYSLCGRDFVRIGEYYLKDAAIREHMQAQISRFHHGKLELEDILSVQRLWKRYIKHYKDGRLNAEAFMPATGLDRMQKSGS